MYDFGEKVVNGGATDAGKLSHGEDNVRFRELENVVTTGGGTLDPPGGASNSQNKMARAIASYASGGVNLEDTGSANAYVLQTPETFLLPQEYFDGMEISFLPANTNTGDSTINANSIGAKEIRTFDGSQIAAGDIVAGRHVAARYDAATGYFRVLPWALASFTSQNGAGAKVTTGLPFALIASASFTPTGTPALVHSAGFSLLTDIGTGHYRLAFDVAEPDTNYIVFTNSEEHSVIYGTHVHGTFEARAADKTTTFFDIFTSYHDRGFDYNHEPDRVSVMVFRS